MSKVNVTLVKSPYGRNPVHRNTLRALGLRRLGQNRIHTISPVTQGMIRQVSYLLKVEDVK